MDNKTYLTDLPSDTVYKMINGSTILADNICDSLAESNKFLADNTFIDIVSKKTYDEDIKIDRTSYSWYANIKGGHYEGMLNLDLGYMSSQDADEIRRLQKELKAMTEKIDNLEDCSDYYERLGEMEDRADEIANQILQIIVDKIKRLEEVTIDQIKYEIQLGEIIKDYYILNNNKSLIYYDHTDTFETNYKGE